MTSLKTVFALVAVMTFFGAVKERIASYLSTLKEIAQTAYLFQKTFEAYRFGRQTLVLLLRQWEQAHPDKQWRSVNALLKKSLIAPIITDRGRRVSIYREAKGSAQQGKFSVVRTRTFRVAAVDELENAIYATLKHYCPHPKTREVILQRLLERIKLER